MDQYFWGPAQKDELSAVQPKKPDEQAPLGTYQVPAGQDHLGAVAAGCSGFGGSGCGGCGACAPVPVTALQMLAFVEQPWKVTTLLASAHRKKEPRPAVPLQSLKKRFGPVHTEVEMLCGTQPMKPLEQPQAGVM